VRDVSVDLWWVNFFLGVIASATLVMAIILVGAIVYASGLARRVDRLTEQLELEIKPFLVHLTSISNSADRASLLAVTQVERFDRMFADFSRRVDEVLVMLERVVIAPAREGRAVLGAVQAAFAVFREVRRGARSRPARMDDEDALFIG
jgi:hypothetical protein